MRATVVEVAGVAAGALGLIGFVVAAATVSPVLAIVVASASLLGCGVLAIWVAARIPDKPKDGGEKS